MGIEKNKNKKTRKCSLVNNFNFTTCEVRLLTWGTLLTYLLELEVFLI